MAMRRMRFLAEEDWTGPLSTRGRWIVDADGDRFKLRSGNWHGKNSKLQCADGDFLIGPLQRAVRGRRVRGRNRVHRPGGVGSNAGRAVLPEGELSSGSGLKAWCCQRRREVSSG